MRLFNVTPYLLLLGQENSNEETLSKANTEFVKEVYELQRAESEYCPFPAAIPELQAGHPA